MNRIILKLLLFFISFTIVNYGCKSGKQATSFKDSKHSIDNLAILSPHVYVEAANKTTSSSDSELAIKLSDRIAGISTSTLKGKYILESETFKLEPGLDGEISSFFNSLDSLKSGVDNIQLPDWLKNDKDGNASRYFMATFVHGYYNPDYEPNYVMKQSMRTNTLMLGRSGLNWVSIKILLADRETNKILFYNADNSYQSDPRILSSIDAMIKKLIQPVYYR